MNYFVIHRAERLFEEYKHLALRYWGAKPSGGPDKWEMKRGAEPLESQESWELRQKINLLYPEVHALAKAFGINTTCLTIPAPVVGGPSIPVDLLLSVINPHMGRVDIAKTESLDAINHCIGAAQVAKRKALKRLVIPVYWIIDIPAFIIRVPFLILRKAGLPRAVEENIVSQIVKTLLLIVGLAMAAYLGLQRLIPDILRFLGN